MVKTLAQRDVTTGKTEKTTGVTFRPQVWLSKRKTNGRADIGATEKMAGSTETQWPHVHACKERRNACYESWWYA